MIAELYPNRPPINKEFALYRKALFLGSLHRLWARLTGRPTHLRDLYETLCCNHIEASHYAGLHPVEIDQIHGSEGKGVAFDSNFYPIKEVTRCRWLGIAKELLHGRDLPPVELVEVGGEYYVRDGHHRISVARSLGQLYIEAEIINIQMVQRLR
jgi:hypothetical protein